MEITNTILTVINVTLIIVINSLFLKESQTFFILSLWLGNTETQK